MKTKSAFIALTACLLFCACSKPFKIDYTELGSRLGKFDKLYSFTDGRIYFDGGDIYVFYSLASPDDVLMTLAVNPKNEITAATLTLKLFSGGEHPENTVEIKNRFREFTKAVFSSFSGFGSEKTDEVMTKIGFNGDFEFFSDYKTEIAEGRFGFILYSNSQSVIAECNFK
ncbi:MAG: hypothetical protein FWF08_08320 [Oscillospiraceae bacterium]|nr:hypothetical protein [Oscillospiraceae bacterium]